MKYKIVALSEEFVDDVVELESELIAKTSREKVLATLSSETLFYYIIFIDEIFAGFVEISIISPEAEIFDIAVKSKFQNIGVATNLLEYIFIECKNKLVETIFLEVNNINQKAINLYTKNGFETYGVRKKYYGENDAVLMKKTL